MFLGRTVLSGEPVWLPADRDIVALWHEQVRTRFWCGHYDWEDREGLEPGYLICEICAEMDPYQLKTLQQNKERQADTHGVTFGWFPPREDEDGD